ncbi:MAG: YceI family protein [Chitinophagales bacterium]
MKNIFLILALFAFSSIQSTFAQGKYFTRDGHVSFFSAAPMENIEAENYKATSIIDTENGRMEFAILIKAFEFEKALMQEHFNENYMESGKYPKATFKGQIQNASVINWTEDGSYEVTVIGDMTIHGVTKNITTKGTIVVENGAISANSTFKVAVADYDIEIPTVVVENIAKEIEVTVDMKYQRLEK